MRFFNLLWLIMFAYKVIWEQSKSNFFKGVNNNLLPVCYFTFHFHRFYDLCFFDVQSNSFHKNIVSFLLKKFWLFLLFLLWHIGLCWFNKFDRNLRGMMIMDISGKNNILPPFNLDQNNQNKSPNFEGFKIIKYFYMNLLKVKT